MKFVLKELRNYSSNTAKITKVRKEIEKFLWVVFGDDELSDFRAKIQGLVFNINEDNPNAPDLYFETLNGGKIIRVKEWGDREIVAIFQELKGEYVVKKKN